MSRREPTIEDIERFPSLATEESIRRSRQIAGLAIQCAKITFDFEEVYRIPRTPNGERESDVTHSFMLEMAAPEIARVLKLPLDRDKIRRFAHVHDMLEIKVGDVATFDLTPEQFAEKERIEQAALEELLQELPEITRQDLEEYELQDTPEAVFVRMVDKLLPVAVDVVGDGVRVVREDYGIKNLEELIVSHNKLHARINEKFGGDYPELVAAHAQLCLIFEDHYKDAIENETVTQKIPRGPVETERKFFIESIPPEIELSSYKHSRLRQGYIAVGGDGSETRIRSFDGKRFELTVKSPGMLQRDEQTISISPEMFNSLWQQTNGRQIEKTRYYIPHPDGYTIELDVYGGHLEGLITAEVEFRGRATEAKVRADTFVPPEWFKADVTTDPRYKNHQLATSPHHMPLEMGAKHY